MARGKKKPKRKNNDSADGASTGDTVLANPNRPSSKPNIHPITPAASMNRMSKRGQAKKPPVDEITTKKRDDPPDSAQRGPYNDKNLIGQLRPKQKKKSKPQQKPKDINQSRKMNTSKDKKLKSQLNPKSKKTKRQQQPQKKKQMKHQQKQKDTNQSRKTSKATAGVRGFSHEEHFPGNDHGTVFLCSTFRLQFCFPKRSRPKQNYRSDDTAALWKAGRDTR